MSQAIGRLRGGLEGDRCTSTRCWSSQTSSSPGSNLTNLPNFEERDPPLGDEAPDMPARDPQSFGDAVDVQQWVPSVCPRN